VTNRNDDTGGAGGPVTDAKRQVTVTGLTGTCGNADARELPPTWRRKP